LTIADTGATEGSLHGTNVEYNKLTLAGAGKATIDIGTGYTLTVTNTEVDIVAGQINLAASGGVLKLKALNSTQLTQLSKLTLATGTEKSLTSATATTSQSPIGTGFADGQNNQGQDVAGNLAVKATYNSASSADSQAAQIATGAADGTADAHTASAILTAGSGDVIITDGSGGNQISTASLLLRTAD
jgi:hypothetical protein